MLARANLYPLKFRPRFVEKIWGGRKLQTVLGKPLPAGKMIGESWELYDFPPGVVENSRDRVSSEIANGPLSGRTLHWAVKELGPQLYGSVSLSGPHGQFPVLIKFLDAREDLSVQVHPDQTYAAANPGAHLKTEAWYVIQSDPGSRLLNGLKKGTTRNAFEQAIRGGSVEQLIRAVLARQGDCFYLPSGTVHALGAGILVAEVQTPSDTTFRVFDFERTDPSTGRPRTLHVDEALKCIDFGAPGGGEPVDVNSAQLVDSPFFVLHRGALRDARQSFEEERPRVLIIVEGSADVQTQQHSVPAQRGDVVLIPAAAQNPSIETRHACAWLEVTFPA
jgi:mannose-6-phosphate isomerase